MSGRTTANLFQDNREDVSILQREEGIQRIVELHVEAQALCQSLNDLHTAFKNRFSKMSKRQTGFPKFKSKHSRQSYRTCMPRSNALGIKTVKIPKVGEVRFRAKPRVSGTRA